MGSGRRTAATSPWNRYVEAAVRGEAAVPGHAGSHQFPAETVAAARDAPEVRPALAAGRRRTLPVPASVRRGGWEQRLRSLENMWRAAVADMAGKGRAPGKEAPRRRTDVRLALPAAAVWGSAVVGLWLQPAALAVLCCALVVLAVLLLRGARQQAAGVRGCRPVAGSDPIRTSRSFLATGAAALFLAAAAAAHSAVASSQRFDGPLAEAVAAGKSVVGVVEVGGIPRALTAPEQAGPPARWSVAVWTRDFSTGGVQLRTRAQLVVMGSGGWGSVVPGQLVRVTGKLRSPDPGREEAAILVASTGPAPAAAGRPGVSAVLQGAARELRERFVAAAAFLAPDPRGLLPGMVTGDTSALDDGLDGAMKNVGMTHLTAVSGANCALVLGALLLGCRSLRVPRVPAAVLAGAGLCLFVVLVGPDASVLRAALMGVVSVASLAGGRSGRGLSFLCLAVIGLLLAEPGLGSSFGFLLSVLATLGIIILGRQMIDWVPAAIPRWVAAAVAVPLSAQLLCGPVIVLLQPQFSTYSLLANVIASPLVAPVTLLGTAAVPLVAWAPWPATALIAVAGTFSAGVAATARFTSQLPGASLPWPEGVPGLLTMVLLSVLTFASVWAVVRPERLAAAVVALHRRIVILIGSLEMWWVGARNRSGRRPPPGRATADASSRRSGLERRAGHGRLGYSTKIPGRNPRWPLHKSEQPVRRHQMRRHGGT